MRRKVQPSERIRKEIRRLRKEGTSVEGSVLEALLSSGARLVLQELLEQKVSEFLGRGHYERRKDGQPHRGCRNGYEPGKVRTAEGRVEVSIPQVRDADRPFVSKLRRSFAENTEVLSRLAAEMYARGLSDREIEDALYDATGDRLLSKSSVSAVYRP